MQDLQRVNSRQENCDCRVGVMLCDVAAIVCYGASNKQAYGTNIYILYGASCFDCIFQMN